METQLEAFWQLHSPAQLPPALQLSSRLTACDCQKECAVCIASCDVPQDQVTQQQLQTAPTVACLAVHLQLCCAAASCIAGIT